MYNFVLCRNLSTIIMFYILLLKLLCGQFAGDKSSIDLTEIVPLEFKIHYMPLVLIDHLCIPNSKVIRSCFVCVVSLSHESAAIIMS